MVFMQLCLFYHQEKHWAQTESSNQSQSNVSSLGISSKTKKKDLNFDLDATLGLVWVSDSHQPICIPANSAKVVSGKTNKITKHLTCMVEARSNNNLPMGVVVNRTIITPTKSKCVLVILMNTNSYNVWIHQSLLAADIVEADHCLGIINPFLSCKGDEVKVTFHPVPSLEVPRGNLVFCYQ